MSNKRVLRWTISGKYEIDDETAQENYGTLDAQEMAKLDLGNLRDDPGPFIDGSADRFDIVVEHDPL